MIVFIETGALVGVLITSNQRSLLINENNRIDDEEHRFYGKWKEQNGPEEFDFRDDGTLTINETGSHFGMGAYQEGYILWNGTWHIEKSVGPANQSSYILVVTNLTRIGGHPAILIRGKFNEGDTLEIIYIFQEKLYGIALYLFLSAYNPVRYDKIA
jgi:hypothetical protein